MAFNSKFKVNNAFSYNMYLWLVSAILSRYDWFIFGTLIVYNVGLDARKPVFGGLRTTQAQTSLRIRADWSASLLFAYRKYHI